jgi:OOP family OmpA-OmpF porin
MFKNFLALFILLLACLNVSSKEVSEHSLFPAPDGYFAHTEIKNSEFDNFKLSNPLYCDKKLCKNSNLGFSNSGYLSIEGKVSTIAYQKADKQRVVKLLLIRNYQKVIEQLGGKAVSDIESEGTTLFLIEKPTTKIWIILSLGNSFEYFLTVVESNVARQILVAGQLADQINKQGFVNLNVNFDTNKSFIKDGDKPAIDEVVTLLKNDPNLKLSVEGHTDNVGNAVANKTLSQARSDSLVAYMVAAGISSKRLVAKGYGSESPISDNRTDEGKAKNRRVELVKIK